MQRFHLSRVRLLFASLMLGLLCACGNMISTDPGQRAIDQTVAGCNATRAAVEATDAAVLAGRITKPAATKALIGFSAMRDGCAAAVAALQAAPPASGAKP